MTWVINIIGNGDIHASQENTFIQSSTSKYPAAPICNISRQNHNAHYNLNPALTLRYQFYRTMNLSAVLTVFQQHLYKNRNIRALQYRIELRELGFIT